MEKQHPQVGVGVIVKKGERVLLGLRKGSHGAGTWCFPGGHLEFFEDVFDCAARETLEETGVAITNMRQGPYTNDLLDQDRKHYATLYVIADHVSGIERVCEPDKCEQWKWFAWNELPTPLFTPVENLKKTGFDPFA